MLAAGGLLIAALDSKPLVERSETISPMAVASARWLLKSNDPRRLQSGDARRAAIPAALIDEGINYLASRNLRGRGALVLAEETAEIRLTLRPPIFNGYINLRANLREASGEPHLTSASIGTLPLPPWLVELVLHNAIRLAGFEHEWQLAKRALRSLEFDPSRQRVIVSYVWEPALLDRARNIAVSPQDVARIRSAHENLAGLLDHKAPGGRVPLVEVLKPMLDIGGDDQYANRRAAILAVAAYLSEKTSPMSFLKHRTGRVCARCCSLCWAVVTAPSILRFQPPSPPGLANRLPTRLASIRNCSMPVMAAASLSPTWPLTAPAHALANYSRLSPAVSTACWPASLPIRHWSRC
jgi:hypothetical protein